MEINPVVLSIPIFFILIGIEVAYGHFKDQKIYRLNDAVTNISCGIVEQLTGVFAKVFTVAAYYFVYEHFAVFELSNAWYWIFLCFLGIDFCYYWAHRASHEVNLFWLGHVVHHQSEDYNLSVALRQSVFQKMFTFYFYFPLAILGFKTEWFVLIGAFNLLYQFWIHTEVINKLPRWFEFVFNTPSHHRVHHGRNPKYIDRNHAGSLMLWDRIFGTFQEEEERPTYGITNPTNSWNPVMANIQPFMRLYHELKTIRGFGNKFRFTFAPPGWYPKEMGGFRPPREVEKDTYKKFDVIVSSRLNFYLFFQYLLILGATAFFLFNLGAYSIYVQLIFAGLIVFSVAVLGSFFDNRRQAVLLEIGRFALSIGMGIYLYSSAYSGLWLPIALVAIALFSIVSILQLKFHKVATVK